MAIVFALPFSSRILFHNEIGPWNSFAQAFFHTHLELFLGNACLGMNSFHSLYSPAGQNQPCRIIKATGLTACYDFVFEILQIRTGTTIRSPKTCKQMAEKQQNKTPKNQSKLVWGIRPQLSSIVAHMACR